MDHAYAQSARLIENKARSFSFAARFLPAQVRRDVYLLYAFCRTVDDIADLPEDGASTHAVRTRLDQWRDWLRAGAPYDDDPIKYGLAHVIRERGLPLYPLCELLDGLYDDLQPRHLPDGAALDLYCYRVAGTVGIAMAALLGARDPRALGHARDLGIAMQLTNVLRDVGEDLDRGRIYLPAAEMERRGYRRRDLEHGVVDERFAALMRHYIERARRYYTSGLVGLQFLPRDCRLPIALAAHTYAAILTRIEQAGFDIFAQRVSTGRREKVLMAVRLGLHHAALGWPTRRADASHAVSFIRRGADRAPHGIRFK